MQTLEKNETLNTQIVQSAFDAFGRGDIPAIIDLVTEDVDWQPIKGTSRNDVPSAGIWRGPAEVTRFFTILGETLAFSNFEPREYIAQGDNIVALGFYQAKVMTTGKTFMADWAMVFTIQNGKIAEFREYTDTKSITEAFK